MASSCSVDIYWKRHDLNKEEKLRSCKMTAQLKAPLLKQGERGERDPENEATLKETDLEKLTGLRETYLVAMDTNEVFTPVQGVFNFPERYKNLLILGKEKAKEEKEHREKGKEKEKNKEKERMESDDSAVEVMLSDDEKEREVQQRFHNLCPPSSSSSSSDSDADTVFTIQRPPYSQLQQRQRQTQMQQQQHQDEFEVLNVDPRTTPQDHSEKLLTWGQYFGSYLWETVNKVQAICNTVRNPFTEELSNTEMEQVTWLQDLYLAEKLGAALPLFLRLNPSKTHPVFAPSTKKFEATRWKSSNNLVDDKWLFKRNITEKAFLAICMICDHQKTESQRYPRPYLDHPANLMLEELKHWLSTLHTMSPGKELHANILARIRYLERIAEKRTFPQLQLVLQEVILQVVALGQICQKEIDRLQDKNLQAELEEVKKRKEEEERNRLQLLQKHSAQQEEFKKAIRELQEKIGQSRQQEQAMLENQSHLVEQIKKLQEEKRILLTDLNARQGLAEELAKSEKNITELQEALNMAKDQIQKKEESHRDFESKLEELKNQMRETNPNAKQSESKECRICFETREDWIACRPCGHVFCAECGGGVDGICHVCRQPYDELTKLYF